MIEIFFQLGLANVDFVDHIKTNIMSTFKNYESVLDLNHPAPFYSILFYSILFYFVLLFNLFIFCFVIHSYLMWSTYRVSFFTK